MGSGRRKRANVVHKIRSLDYKNRHSILIFKVLVGDPIYTRDKVNSWYISGDNPHLTSRFCKDELSLNSLPNIVLESILVNFDRPIESLSTNI